MEALDAEALAQLVKIPCRALRVHGFCASILCENPLTDQFHSGVVCIADWKISNTIQADRYHETIYTQEKALLVVQDNKRYEPTEDYYSHVLNLDT